MARYRLRWLEIAEQQYLDLLPDARQLVEDCLARLVEDPTDGLGAVQDERSDQWSVPLANEGFLFYAVVHDPATVIVLRVLYGLT